MDATLVSPGRKVKGSIDVAECSFSRGLSSGSRGAGGFRHNNGYADFRMDSCTGPIQLLIINLNRLV